MNAALTILNVKQVLYSFNISAAVGCVNNRIMKDSGLGPGLNVETMGDVGSA
jgi:hypothetical protein